MPLPTDTLNSNAASSYGVLKGRQRVCLARPVPGTASARVEAARGVTGVSPDVCVRCVGWAGQSAVTAVRPRRGAIVTARARRGVEALCGAARVRLSRVFLHVLWFLT
jgi:hypothetical protein